MEYLVPNMIGIGCLGLVCLLMAWLDHKYPRSAQEEAEFYANISPNPYHRNRQ